jgi:glycerol-3-phosphate acyltransferase PlsY
LCGNPPYFEIVFSILPCSETIKIGRSMSETLIFILLTVGGYLIGSIPMAYLVVKWRYKKDIREYGSGSVGGSNVFRSFSRPWGYTVGVYDAIKGIILVGIAHLLGLQTAYQAIIGLAVIAGHDWPVFLKFNAGRGLATALGVCFVIFPLGIVIFIAFAIFTLVIKSSALPSLIGMAAMPISAWILHKPDAVIFGLTALWLIIVLRRISAPLTERSKEVSRRALLLNRFLFDRDIRDAKAWTAWGADSVKANKTGKDQ